MAVGGRTGWAEPILKPLSELIGRTGSGRAHTQMSDTVAALAVRAHLPLRHAGTSTASRSITPAGAHRMATCMSVSGHRVCGVWRSWTPMNALRLVSRSKQSLSGVDAASDPCAGAEVSRGVSGRGGEHDGCLPTLAWWNGQLARHAVGRPGDAGHRELHRGLQRLGAGGAPLSLLEVAAHAGGTVRARGQRDEGWAAEWQDGVALAMAQPSSSASAARASSASIASSSCSMSSAISASGLTCPAERLPMRQTPDGSSCHRSCRRPSRSRTT